ncbi:hypothetical protein ACMZ6Y_06045 [Streptococcus pluranimalium]
MASKINKNHLYSFFLIFATSFILCLPQMMSGNMILGSDAIFHFNRFYDTAQQIKNLDFHYFISLYGFQGSGRIVNALYGPLFAYAQGLLVLMSKNWFIYQVLSNFCLYNLAGLAMYYFLIKAKLNSKYAGVGALLYLSTYSIQYWTIRQGFTSWGAALLPIALSILFDLEQTNHVPRWYLGSLTALMVQTHMLSAFLLILIYLPFFTIAFLKSNDKITFLKDLVIEIGLFFGLTLNIWGAYFMILKDNQLISPFVNSHMSLNTINHNSYYWLVNPAILFVLLLVIYWLFLIKWQQIKKLNITLWLGVMTVFLVLSSSLIPWSYLVEADNPVAKLIQYPFRFFVPVSIMIIYLFLKLVQSQQVIRNHKRFVVSSFLVLSLLQTVILIGLAAHNWHSSSDFMPSKYKVVFLSDTANIKQSFYDLNKEKALKLLVKGTPDYLPLYDQKEGDDTYYDLYLEKIVRQKAFKKFVKDGKLILEWTATTDKRVELPVIVYKNTLLELNGKILPHDQLSLSPIGTPRLNQMPYQKNRVILSYKAPISFDICLAITLLMWGVTVVTLLKKWPK